SASMSCGARFRQYSIAPMPEARYRCDRAGVATRDRRDGRCPFRCSSAFESIERSELFDFELTRVVEKLIRAIPAARELVAKTLRPLADCPRRRQAADGGGPQGGLDH